MYFTLDLKQIQILKSNMTCIERAEVIHCTCNCLQYFLSRLYIQAMHPRNSKTLLMTQVANVLIILWIIIDDKVPSYLDT